jgi:hypothetical protein
VARQGVTPELYEANYAAWLDDTHSPAWSEAADQLCRSNRHTNRRGSTIRTARGVRQPTSSAVPTVTPTATIRQRAIDIARVQPCVRSSAYRCHVHDSPFRPCRSRPSDDTRSERPAAHRPLSRMRRDDAVDAERLGARRQPVGRLSLPERSRDRSGRHARMPHLRRARHAPRVAERGRAERAHMQSMRRTFFGRQLTVG